MSEVQETETAEITPRIRGRFALYDILDGGIHVAWIPEDSPDEETQHFEVPGMVLRMAKAASEGKLNPADMVKMMMGNGNGSE
jgi:hypothetical protein